MEELYLYRRNLLEALAAVVSELQRVCTTIPANAWHTPVNMDGKNRHQLLAQLGYLEAQVFYPRMVRIIYEDSPHLPALDDSAWEHSSYNPSEPPEGILVAYARLRDAELALLQNLPPAGWNRMGVHPWLGKRTLQWWAERCLVYSLMHMKQMIVARGGEAL